jgi:hypothetical protein
MTDAFLTRAVLRPKGNRLEDSTFGRTFVHHRGRTINHGDNSLSMGIVTRHTEGFNQKDLRVIDFMPQARPE